MGAAYGAGAEVSGAETSALWRAFGYEHDGEGVAAIAFERMVAKLGSDPELAENLQRLAADAAI